MEPPHLARQDYTEGAPALTKAGVMLSELAQKESLFRLLHKIDLELADSQRQRGCIHCGGALHWASYERKPRGGPSCLPNEYTIRLSLCCGREGCRKRCLPPSTLYYGRRVYWGCIILVVMALRQRRPDGLSARRLRQLYGVSRQTIIRWMAYFARVFPDSPVWQRLRGSAALVAGLSDEILPVALLESFLAHAPTPMDGLVGCVRLLAIGGME